MKTFNYKLNTIGWYGALASLLVCIVFSSCKKDNTLDLYVVDGNIKIWYDKIKELKNNLK